jgi:hypothetical protein
MLHDSDDCRSEARAVFARIADLERARVEAGDQSRSGSVRQDGELVRLIVPHGYETLVEPLVERFGAILIVEYDDGWRAWAP